MEVMGHSTIPVQLHDEKINKTREKNKHIVKSTDIQETRRGSKSEEAVQRRRGRISSS
jgi:hypothetical protein